MDLKKITEKINSCNNIEIIMKQNGKKHDNIINILVSHCLSIIFFLFGTLNFTNISIKEYKKDSINVLFKTESLNIKILCSNDSCAKKIRQIKLCDKNNFLHVVDFSQTVGKSAMFVDFSNVHFDKAAPSVRLPSHGIYLTPKTGVDEAH